MNGSAQAALYEFLRPSASRWMGSWLGKQLLHAARSPRWPEQKIWKTAALTSSRNFKAKRRTQLKPSSIQKRPWTTVIRKNIWRAALIFNISHWTETFFLLFPKQQIIANPLLHITYHLSPHQRLLESDGIKYSSQAVFVKSNNYIVTRIYN